MYIDESLLDITKRLLSGFLYEYMIPKWSKKWQASFYG